jgi:hypothetical protein
MKKIVNKNQSKLTQYGDKYNEKKLNNQNILTYVNIIVIFFNNISFYSFLFVINY